MPKSKVPEPALHPCRHATLCLDPSTHAAGAGYKRPTAQQRAAAVTTSGRVKGNQDIAVPDPGTFPAPLVLPGDDLALDPTYPAQSFRSWLREQDRNTVTPERRTIYVASPPDVDAEVDFLKGWGTPRSTLRKDQKRDDTDVLSLNLSTVLHYLEAFYCGLPVRFLPPSALKFAAWDDDDVAPEPASNRPKSKLASSSSSEPAIPAHVALHTTTEAIRIRIRPLLPAPSATFPAQLNLNDLLDAAIALVPDDAYALLLLVAQDLFEDAEDDFVCGRAYGGSRVAVVSAARYHPALGVVKGGGEEGRGGQGLQHDWPGSHCGEYVARCCADEGSRAAVRRRGTGDLGVGGREAGGSGLGGSAAVVTDGHGDLMLSSMQAAVSAHLTLPDFVDLEDLEGLWSARVCKTASHELGHCFGIDHCVYYACIMQGSASLAEDARQPPYLCPVDEAKLGWAVAESDGKLGGVAKGGGDEWKLRERGEWRGERRVKLRDFCADTGRRERFLWGAYGTWLGMHDRIDTGLGGFVHT